MRQTAFHSTSNSFSYYDIKFPTLRSRQEQQRCQQRISEILPASQCYQWLSTVWRKSCSSLWLLRMCQPMKYIHIEPLWHEWCGLLWAWQILWEALSRSTLWTCSKRGRESVALWSYLHPEKIFPWRKYKYGNVWKSFEM